MVTSAGLQSKQILVSRCETFGILEKNKYFQVSHHWESHGVAPAENWMTF